jgi:hypothetical protein
MSSNVSNWTGAIRERAPRRLSELGDSVGRSVRDWTTAGEDAATIARRAGTGFVAGAVGAGLVAAAMFAMRSAGVAPEPLFIDAEQAIAGRHGRRFDTAAGTAGLLAAGGLWGALLGGAVRHPGARSGLACGAASALLGWIAYARLKGERLFSHYSLRQILLPLAVDCAMWGCFVGWFQHRRAR